MDNLLLCTIINKGMVKQKKKLNFANYMGIKTLHADLLPSYQEAGIMFTINEETFYMFTKNTWISDSGTLCHVTNENTGLCDITKITFPWSIESAHQSRSTKINLKCINCPYLYEGIHNNSLCPWQKPFIWPPSLNFNPFTFTYQWPTAALQPLLPSKLPR